MKAQKNVVHQMLIADLKRKPSKAGLWGDLVRRLSQMNEVNVGKLAKVTKKSDVVAVPGKVLGAGEITHSITVGAEKFSGLAIAKIEGAGGKAISLAQLAEMRADGKGVRIIAG